MMINAMKYMKAIMLACTVLGTTAISAQQDSRILAMARDSAEYAGGGRFCGLDRDMVEDFIVKVDARMALLAKDDYEKILARLEFKNLLDVYSVKEPEAGCEAFEATFLRAMKALSQ